MSVKVNIVIEQNSNFSLDYSLNDPFGNPLDLTGYTFVGKIKRHYLSANSIPLQITISNNIMTISLTANQTSSDVLDAGRAVYDIQGISSSNVSSRLIEGLATISPGVSP